MLDKKLLLPFALFVLSVTDCQVVLAVVPWKLLPAVSQICTNKEALTSLSKGETPGPESSIGKVVSAPKMQDLASFAMDLQGAAGILNDPDMSLMHSIFQNQWMSAAGYRIAGGTDEILRNIVAERVLGLPQDIRVDKNVPFNELADSR